jgi:hypothetical protein
MFKEIVISKFVEAVEDLRSTARKFYEIVLYKQAYSNFYFVKIFMEPETE